MKNENIIKQLKRLIPSLQYADDVNAVKGAIQALSQEPCDDAISRILKKMWNCRGKHTTSIDKVKMEQIIRDELSVTHKSGKWIERDKRVYYAYWERYKCSKCGHYGDNDYKFCPNCGCRMVEPQESEEQTE